MLRCSVAAAQLLKPICGVILQIDARFVLHAAVTTSPHRSMFNLPCLAACLGQRPEGCTTPNGNKRRTAAASDLRPQWLRANPYCLRRRQHSNSGTVQARLPVAFLVNYLAARLRHSGGSPWVGGCPFLRLSYRLTNARRGAGATGRGTPPVGLGTHAWWRVGAVCFGSPAAPAGS